ncbi:hypothetical protein [Gracilibacillus sp. YIM 98692]|uniref:beta-xylosidase family glycoside hydrolase n=1 Tax=Gracilibacillus sp. YIM 98692 TaxID=2663532 RepID=UPI001969D1F8|nr:hypothetical protein [Gracilibacillus sp. YIM 98692]
MVLGVRAVGNKYSFFYAKEGERFTTLYDNGDGKQINPPNIGGMMGTLLGVYASSNGKESENNVEFEWFDYVGTE